MALDKPVGAITESDLIALVNQKETESKSLDYKLALNFNDEAAKSEFRRDVTSFANSSGGDIVVGIRDNQGVPEKLEGFDLGAASEEQYRLRIVEILQSRIKPRIQGVVIRLLQLQGGKWAAIIRIPQSIARPHQVEINNKDFQFWFRHDGGKQRMDIDELRSSILLSEGLSERIRAFRIERLGRIISGETPVPLLKGTKIVLHLVPVQSFNSFSFCDLSSITNRAGLLSPIYSVTSGGFRYNFDGYFVHDKHHQEAEAGSYVQVFTNGIVESVEGRMFSYSQGRVIDSYRFEELLITALTRYRSLQEQLGVIPPVLVMLSLLDVSGYSLSTPPDVYRSDPSRSITDQNLVVPEVLIADPDLPSDQVLKSALDRIWNAAGWEKSPYYNVQGKHIG